MKEARKSQELLEFNPNNWLDCKLRAARGQFSVVLLPSSTNGHHFPSVSLLVISTDRQRVVAGDEEDVEDGGGGQVAGQQAARVGQDGLGVDDRQAEEGDGPDPVEDLE